MSISTHIATFASGSTQGAAGPGPTGSSDASGICTPNISPRERRRRLMAGVIQFAIGLAVLGALIAIGADRWWRLPLFLMFWGAAGGFFQWRDKT